MSEHQRVARPDTGRQPPQQLPNQDETTRLLSAAAHLNTDFCTLAIREFLTEPLRAVVPSPGADDAAVLREAVAARTRRRWRDGALAVLLLGVGVLSPVLLGGWLFVAALWSAFGPRRRNLDEGVRPRLSSRALAVAVLAGSAVLVGTAAATARSALSGSDSGFGAGFDPSQQQGGGSGAVVRLAIAAVLVLGIAAVLVADRLTVWSLLTRTFRRGAFSATPAPGERMRTLGSGGPAGRLLRQRASIPHGNVVVYDNDKPFVGWGRPFRTWSIAIPLEPADQAGDQLRGNGHGAPPRRLPAAFPLFELYDHIGRYLAQLRGSAPALSPSFRLRELEEFETLFVPAAELVGNIGTPVANLVLPRADQAPVPRLEPGHTRWVAEQPVEWLRYYRGFQVEAWDRNLVVSVFLHVGADRDMLYFECTPCVLAPIHAGYRTIDLLSQRSRRAPLLDALGSLTVLPVSIFTRLGHSFRSITPARTDHHGLTADRYGARFSLRELAAASALTDYLKVRDVDRYLLLMQDRIFKATYEFLDARGISSKVFREKANIIQNNAYNSFDQRNSSFNGSMFGTVNVTENAAPAQPAPA